MNKIWLFIIFISIAFGIFFGNTKTMIENLFLTFNNTLKTLIQIASMVIVYNGLFQIAIDSSIIKRLSKLLFKPLNKIFKTTNLETKELIAASIIANLLGLGPANMSIAVQVIEKINNQEKWKSYDLTMYLLVNISSLCILPLSLITLRSIFFSKITIAFIPMLFISSFLTTMFAIILVKCGKYHE